MCIRDSIDRQYKPQQQINNICIHRQIPGRQNVNQNNREVSLMNRKNSGNEEIEIVKEIKANRKYKDTVFRMLFSNKEKMCIRDRLSG